MTAQWDLYNTAAGNDTVAARDGDDPGFFNARPVYRATFPQSSGSLIYRFVSIHLFLLFTCLAFANLNTKLPIYRLVVQSTCSRFVVN
jgi:hypothetical protein